MSLDAEQAVLGSILRNPDLIDDTYLRPDDFDSEGNNGLVFEALSWAHEAFSNKPGVKDPFDPVLLAEHWGAQLSKIGGLTYLMQLRSSVPSTSNFDHYQKIVRESSIQAKAAHAMRAALNGGNLNLSAVRENLEKLEELQEQTINDGMKKMSDVLDGHHKEVMSRSGRSGITGVKTASDDYNDMSGGHQRSDVTIVAARPSIGKTAYIVNDSTSSAKSGWTVALFSAEMPDEDVAERFICSIGGIDSKKVRDGLLSENDWANYSTALDILDTLPIFIDDTPGMSIEYIRRQIKQMKKKHKNLIVYIDYLQLIESEKNFSQNAERVNYVSKQLKQIARTFDIPVVAISSVGRKCEERQDKRPMMSDLRESGNIEFDADVIIFLYRDDYYYPDTVLKGLIELIIAKGRKIGTGTIQMFFNRKNGRFSNLTKDQKYEFQKKVREHEQTHSKR